VLFNYYFTFRTIHFVSQFHILGGIAFFHLQQTFRTPLIKNLSAAFAPSTDIDDIIAIFRTSILCSMMTMELPLVINLLKAMSNFLTSSKCSPVVGSSKMNSVWRTLFSLVRKLASLTRCASPPDKLEEDCPNLT
jgi:hypothetical protein